MARSIALYGEDGAHYSTTCDPFLQQFLCFDDIPKSGMTFGKSHLSSLWQVLCLTVSIIQPFWLFIHSRVNFFRVANHMGNPYGCRHGCDKEHLLNFTGFSPFNDPAHFHSYCEIENWSNQTQVSGIKDPRQVQILNVKNTFDMSSVAYRRSYLTFLNTQNRS